VRSAACLTVHYYLPPPYAQRCLLHAGSALPRYRTTSTLPAPPLSPFTLNLFDWFLGGPSYRVLNRNRYLPSNLKHTAFSIRHQYGLLRYRLDAAH